MTLFRYLAILLALHFPALYAADRVALVGKGESSLVKDFVKTQVKAFESPVALMCEPEVTVLVLHQTDLVALDRLCAVPPSIFAVSLNATDAILARPRVSGFFSFQSLFNQLEAALGLVEGSFTVLYSEQVEREAIEQFRQKYPQQVLEVVEVSSSPAAIKALGRSVLKSSAVILGGNPEVFNEAFLLTARKISLKFLTPLVGGSSSQQLKKGTVFGVFVSEDHALQATQHWLETGESHQPQAILMTNQKMMGYFGLSK